MHVNNTYYKYHVICIVDLSFRDIEIPQRRGISKKKCHYS